MTNDNNGTGCRVQKRASGNKCVIGIMPVTVSPSQSGAARAMVRCRLRSAVGNYTTSSKRCGTPFRVLMNLGPSNCAFNTGPTKGVNQVGGIRGGLVLSRASNAGSVVTGSSDYSGNPRFVADSSQYTEFKKLLAHQRLYNAPFKA